MNWGQIKAAVGQYLENAEPSFLANLPLFARLAEEDIYRKVQLPMNRQTSTANLSLGDPLLFLPTDALSVYMLSLLISTNPSLPGQVFPLLSKDEGFLLEVYPPYVRGQPRFYAVRNDKNLLVAPTPNAYYTVQMQYFKKPASISLNDVAANTNWLSLNAENALLFGIIMHGYIYEKGDQDIIQYYAKQFETALTDLKLIVEGRQRKDSYRTPDERMPV
jgi:hypothetical protein